MEKSRNVITEDAFRQLVDKNPIKDKRGRGDKNENNSKNGNTREKGP